MNLNELIDHLIHLRNGDFEGKGKEEVVFYGNEYNESISCVCKQDDGVILYPVQPK